MLTWEKIPGSPRFYVLQATKSWAGPGDEATVVHLVVHGCTQLYAVMTSLYMYTVVQCTHCTWTWLWHGCTHCTWTWLWCGCTRWYIVVHSCAYGCTWLHAAVHTVVWLYMVVHVCMAVHGCTHGWGNDTVNNMHAYFLLRGQILITLLIGQAWFNGQIVGIQQLLNYVAIFTTQARVGKMVLPSMSTSMWWIWN